jgi:selenocysteine lyase/cysteine desulfurase
MSLSKYRQFFPITLSTVYLNHAAISPLSTYVSEAMKKFISNRTTGDIDLHQKMVDERDRLKGNLATLINTKSHMIALIKNTSEGLNWLANGISWQKGDRILLFENEFPANIYPFLNLKRHGIEVDFVPVQNGKINIEEIERCIHPKTRLLSISFVGFLDGFRNNLSAIGRLCKQKNIIFSVDGIQGVGILPIDVQEAQIDFLSNGGHKWLMGPEGCGFMYISSGLHERLNPAFAGWLSVKNSMDFLNYRLDFRNHADRYEIGTANTFGIVGLRAATDMLIEIGTEKIEAHLLDLGALLIEKMSALNFKYTGATARDDRSGIYSFKGSDVDTLYKVLAERRIFVSLRNDCLRVSPHFYNTNEDIERFIEACKDFV